MRILTFYLPLLLGVVGVYTLQAYLSNLNNIHKGQYSFYLYLSGLVPLWTIASMYTKNMFFDALLYDIAVTLTFALALMYFTDQHLKMINWLGLAMIIGGLILVKR